MGKYFGTDGFRGEANVHLNVEHAYKIGRYLGWFFKKENRKGKIVIGKDTRRSSYMFEYALASGIVASGSDAYLLHVTTTPSVSYVARTEDFDCGIMISASHNVYYDNGIKIIDGQGKKIGGKLEFDLESYLDGKIEVPFAHKEEIGCTIDHQMGRNRYIGYLISLSHCAFQGIKVGLDCSNGSSSSIAKCVFDALGAKTYVINNQPNGLNINRDCGSTHIEALQAFVKSEGLDIGFAYDGDADRCIAVDGKGNVVDGDLILYVCGKYLKSQGLLDKDTVVTTIMSNIGLYKAFDAEGIKYEKTQVGDKYVYENMEKNGYSLGGEQSGHIIFSKYATTGDGIVTSLMLMEAIKEQKTTLEDAIASVTIYPQLLKNVRVSNKDVALGNEVVQACIKKCEEELGEDGRVLVRKSGTEPVIRVMVEAKTNALCNQYVNTIIATMEKQNLVVEN